jgi:hypothetical protein
MSRYLVGGAEQKQLEALNHRRIFLVLQGLTIEEIAKLQPELADRYALSTVIGADKIAEKLVDAIRTAPRRAH